MSKQITTFKFGDAEVDVPSTKAESLSGLASEMQMLGGLTVTVNVMGALDGLSGQVSREFARRFANMFGEAEDEPMSVRECEVFLGLVDYIQMAESAECRSAVEGVVDVLLSHIASGRLPSESAAYRKLFACRPRETARALQKTLGKAYAEGGLPLQHIADAIAVMGPEYALAFKPHAYPFIRLRPTTSTDYISTVAAEDVFLCDPLLACAGPDYVGALGDLVHFEGTPKPPPAAG